MLRGVGLEVAYFLLKLNGYGILSNRDWILQEFANYAGSSFARTHVDAG